MDNQKFLASKFYKIATYVIGILGLVSSIAAGSLFPNKTYNFETGEGISNFNAIIMVFGIISVIIVCMILSGISCILKILENFEAIRNKNILTVDKKLSKEKIEQWECPSCHSMNEYKSRYTTDLECPNCHWHF